VVDEDRSRRDQLLRRDAEAVRRAECQRLRTELVRGDHRRTGSAVDDLVAREVAERVVETLVVLVDGHEEADRLLEVGRLRAELIHDLDDGSVECGRRGDRVALIVVRDGRDARPRCAWCEK
jgi:hypothetical protein